MANPKINKHGTQVVQPTKSIDRGSPAVKAKSGTDLRTGGGK